MPSPRLPGLVVLDVNETLSDLTPLRERFTAVGLDAGTSATWFAAVLRDGFALTALEESAAFADLGHDVLLDLAPHLEEDDVAHVLDGFTSLDLHPDVVPGLRAFAAAGTPVVTLSNGSPAVAEGLLERAGCRDLVGHVLSVEDVGVWKPHPRAYAYALTTAGTGSAAEALMVAVHPWDLHGAHRAGLRTGWVRRGERVWPRAFDRPDHEARGLDALAAAITGASA